MWYKQKHTDQIANNPSVPGVSNAGHKERLAAGWEEYPEYEDVLAAEQAEREAERQAVVDKCKADAANIETKHGVKLPADWMEARDMLNTSTDLKADALALKIFCDEVNVSWQLAVS